MHELKTIPVESFVTSVSRFNDLDDTGTFSIYPY